MADATPSAPAPPPDPATLRRNVWIAVGTVLGLWAVIYITVVVAYVVGGPAPSSTTPASGFGPSPDMAPPATPGPGPADDPHAGHGH